MPTVPVTIQIGYISTVLAAADVAKGQLFGKRIDPQLPVILYVETDILNAIYTANNAWNAIFTTDTVVDGIQEYADYVYALCGRYTAKALNIINGGSGGGVSPSPTPIQYYPIYITQANFTTATFYPNTKIFGSNVIIFWNEVNRYLLPSEFTISSTGITITAVGFDATSGFDANLVIEKVYT